MWPPVIRKMRSVKIGNVTIEYPIALAPLAGVSDEVFRRICKEQGAGLTCTEMVSAKAIVFHNKNTEELMRTSKSESPVSLQLFGSDVESLGEAVRMINDRDFDILDFNMGCPVPKVVKNGEGSFLMTQPEKAGRIFETLVEASKKPVTVKIRAGFDEEHKNAVQIAHIAQESGISAVTVHARTREQYYSGKADWNVIKAVKEAVSIPVFGNGDVSDGPSAKKMLEETRCDGIAVGRAAMGDPWVFREIRHFLMTGETLEKPSQEEIFAMIRRHAKELVELKGEYIGIREMRSHASWYTHGFRGAADIRRRLNTAETLSELLDFFE